VAVCFIVGKKRSGYTKCAGFLGYLTNCCRTDTLHVPSAKIANSRGPFVFPRNIHSNSLLHWCLSWNPKRSQIPHSHIGNRQYFETVCYLVASTSSPAGHPCDITGNMLRYYSTFSYGVGALIQAMNGRNGANITPSLQPYSGTGPGGRHRKFLKLVATSAARSTLD